MLPKPKGPLDLNSPLSGLLRNATAIAHDRVMMPDLITQLVDCKLPKDVYIKYLMVLYRVYSTLETCLDKHSSHPCLASTYNPAVLSRAPGIYRDIAFFLDDPEWDQTGKEGARLLNEVDQEEQVRAYVERLNNLAHGSDRWSEDGPEAKSTPSSNVYFLLSHSYTRYLGDLSGGQQLRTAVLKSFVNPSLYHDNHDIANTDDSTNEGKTNRVLSTSLDGTQFYEFTTLNQPDKLAGPAEVKKIKAWFRTGLDTAGKNFTNEETDAVLKEALFAFDLNFNIFAAFSQNKPKTPLPSAPTSVQLLSSASEQKVIRQLKSWHIASLLAFILAVIASFTWN